MLGQNNTLNFTFLICWTSEWRHGIMTFDIGFINTITCSNLVQYIFIHSCFGIKRWFKDPRVILWKTAMIWLASCLCSPAEHAIQFILLTCYFNECNDDSVWNYLLCKVRLALILVTLDVCLTDGGGCVLGDYFWIPVM